ncbi:uncharacterized protein LOC110194844 [Phascolarctos cinereus]
MNWCGTTDGEEPFPPVDPALSLGTLATAFTVDGERGLAATPAASLGPRLAPPPGSPPWPSPWALSTAAASSPSRGRQALRSHRQSAAAALRSIGGLSSAGCALLRRRCARLPSALRSPLRLLGVSWALAASALPSPPLSSSSPSLPRLR